MTVLQDILSELQQGPTFFSLQKQLSVIAQLIEIPHNTLKEESSTFFEILDILGSNHEQAIFEITAKETPVLAAFGNWLLSLKPCFSEKQEYLTILAETMKATFNN